ncbi:MAG TPA: NAD(+) synthase [Thermomicrobiales bacterium]|jgi:NAD+ synthase (glutamine-hydrolysing)|nr:NAD(+) synthase [Thermomicrobiales bacterium]
MRLVRIGLASINSTVGDFAGNIDQAIARAREMAADDVTVGVFPEQAVGGYAPEDLPQWHGFVEGQWTELQRFAAETADLDLVSVLGVTIAEQGLRYNCAAVVAAGRILGIVPKEKLPTYNVYYEQRVFTRGLPGQHGSHRGVPFGDYLFRFDFGTLAAEVCEDFWSTDGPVRRRAYSGAELIANVSASVYRVGIHATREELVATRAADHQVTYAYANMLGANDAIIFDGGGFISQNGKRLLDAPRFVNGFAATTIDLDRTLRLRTENTTWRDDQRDYASTHTLVPTLAYGSEILDTSSGRARLRYPFPAHRSFFLPDDTPRPTARELLCEEILDALALGIGDYYEKLGAFRQIGVALSGGRDSLLTLLVAHRYARRVSPNDPGALLKAFTMPSRHNTDATKSAAAQICQDLGVPLETIPIHEAHEREIAAVTEMLGPNQPVTELTRQNIQARIRAQRMWNWSNSASGLYLQTGNMSERAVGYTTIAGDLTGGLGVLANVPKTVVNYLLDYLAETTGYEGIAMVLASPAGPELADDQRGEHELMPFPVLDACFHLFAYEKLQPDEITEVLADMFPEWGAEALTGHVDKFTRLFLQNIYKWVQAPISLHIGNLDLDRERALQLPVVQRSTWARGTARGERQAAMVGSGHKPA